MILPARSPSVTASPVPLPGRLAARPSAAGRVRGRSAPRPDRPSSRAETCRSSRASAPVGRAPGQGRPGPSTAGGGAAGGAGCWGWSGWSSPSDRQYSAGHQRPLRCHPRRRTSSARANSMSHALRIRLLSRDITAARISRAVPGSMSGHSFSSSAILAACWRGRRSSIVGPMFERI